MVWFPMLLHQSTVHVGPVRSVLLKMSTHSKTKVGAKLWVSDYWDTILGGIKKQIIKNNLLMGSWAFAELFLQTHQSPSLPLLPVPTPSFPSLRLWSKTFGVFLVYLFLFHLTLLLPFCNTALFFTLHNKLHVQRVSDLYCMCSLL